MKKVIALALTFVMMFTLIACGQEGNTDNSTDNTVNTDANSTENDTNNNEDANTPAEDSSSESYTIGLAMMSTGDEIFTRIINDCQAIADEKGHQLLISDANNDASTQVTAIENFITSGADAIIVQPVDANAIHDALQKAKAEGIMVVALFIGLNDGDWDAWYHNDEYQIGYGVGQMTGEWLNENYGGEGHVGMFEYPMIPTLITRCEGIRDGLAATAPNAEITVTAQGLNADDGLNQTNSMLAADPELVAICAYMDTPLLGAYQAVTIAGKDPAEFGLFGSDGDMVALSYIKEDSYYKGTQAMNSTEFGATAMQMALDLLAGKDVKEDFTIAIPVTAENVEEFMANQ